MQEELYELSKKYHVLYINSCVQVTIAAPSKNILFAETPLSLRILQLRGNTGLDDPCFVQRGLFLLPFLAFFSDTAFCRLALRLRACANRCFVLSSFVVCLRGFY